MAAAFDNFGKSSIECLMFAQEEAAIRMRQEVTEELLLLGVLRHPTVGAEVLRKAGLTFEKLHEVLDKTIGMGASEYDATSPVPLSFGCKAVLEMSQQHATRAGTKFVETEHMVFAMISDPKCALILKRLDIDVDMVKKMLEQGMSAHAGTSFDLILGGALEGTDPQAWTGRSKENEDLIASIACMVHEAKRDTEEKLQAVAEDVSTLRRQCGVFETQVTQQLTDHGKQLNELNERLSSVEKRRCRSRSPRPSLTSLSTVEDISATVDSLSDNDGDMLSGDFLMFPDGVATMPRRSNIPRILGSQATATSGTSGTPSGTSSSGTSGGSTSGGNAQGFNYFANLLQAFGGETTRRDHESTDETTDTYLNLGIYQRRQRRHVGTSSSSGHAASTSGGNGSPRLHF